MAGSITPLPVMLEDEDRKIYERLEPPKSIVVRYGHQRMIAELPYDGDAKPGCGSKLVVRTHRGIELAEMLTTTCPNAGCGSAISRKQMLEYIENSGGKNYPFSNTGKVLRVATPEDLLEQRHLDENRGQMMQFTRALIREMDLPMKLVEIERLLGGERVIFYYTAEQWVDFRDLVKQLAAAYHTRIEMHQVNAREEARLVADYERCGQHCCCKQFLKVLKPVSMKSAKIQKATLDPTKISGRCGRLMCCLRYEDETYADLRKRLPRKQTRVMTEDGPGTVIDAQILTQLALVRLDDQPGMAAYPVEEIQKLDPADDPQRNPELAATQETARRSRERQAMPPRPPRPQRASVPLPHEPDDDLTASDAGPPLDEVESASPAPIESPAGSEESPTDGDTGRRGRRRRRGGRRRRRGGGDAEAGGESVGGDGASPQGGGESEPPQNGANPSPQDSGEANEGGRPRRRRGGRRRRRRGGGGGGAAGTGGGD